MPIVKDIKISGADYMSQVLPSESKKNDKSHEVKRKAWMGAFIASGLFWAIIAASVWHFWGVR